MCATMHLYNGSNRNYRTGQALVSGGSSGSLAGGRWIFILAEESLHPKGLQGLQVRSRTLQLCPVWSQGDRRFSIDVPDELAEDLERAIRNGRDLQNLMTEAGRRYTLALKN